MAREMNQKTQPFFGASRQRRSPDRTRVTPAEERTSKLRNCVRSHRPLRPTSRDHRRRYRQNDGAAGYLEKRVSSLAKLHQVWAT